MRRELVIHIGPTAMSATPVSTSRTDAVNMYFSRLSAALDTVVYFTLKSPPEMVAKDSNMFMLAPYQGTLSHRMKNERMKRMEV